MNREQENLQFLGFIGIYKESFNIIFKWRKIFTKITLALILPFSCIILANTVFSTFLSTKIITNTLNNTQLDSSSDNNKNVSNLIYKEWITYWLVNIVYLMLSLVFLLLSVSAIVYTIACTYIGKQISFKKVISVVPKVWKRLLVTFLSIVCVAFVSTFVFVLVTLICGAVVFSVLHNPNNMKAWYWFGVVFLICGVIYLVVMVYMSFIWQLAYVVSVLEENSGFKAMSKSKALIKGKMGIALAIYLVMVVCSLPNHFFVKQLKLGSGGSFVVGERIWYAILSLVWMTLLFLLNLVVQTVLYFVCKSYHHENIDKSSLADHLEGYHGEYVPLTSKMVQLEGFSNV